MATGKQAIDRLRLDEAFSGKFVHTPLDKCWKAKCDEKLLIIDDIEGSTSRFATDNDDVGKALMIINENKREIILLAIDHQLLTNYPGGEADCAVFDERQFRFVEFKTNAKGNLKGNFDKATRQLTNTIKVFTDKLQNVGVSFRDSVTLSCHVVVSNSFPRSQAAMQNYQFEFATDTGGILLSFDSETNWEESEE